MKSPFPIVTPDQTDNWDSFVAGHPRGSVFHTRAMVNAFRSTKNHEPLAIAATGAAGEIVAMLVAVKVATLGRWAGQFAARSIFYAEPIHEESARGREAAAALIRHHDAYMHRRVLFAEVRPLFAPPPREDDPLLGQGYALLGYLNYELDLTLGRDSLWKNLSSGRRTQIRANAKRGVTVREADPASELETLYGLLEHTYAMSKVPLADRTLFASTFRELPRESYRVLFAEYEGRVLAAACFLVYRGRVIYWYAGTERVKGIAATTCLVWEAIVAAADAGASVFDLAGAGWEGEDYGPGKFKAEFAGKLTNFGRYRRVYAPWKMKCAQSAYATVRGLISPSMKSSGAVNAGSAS